MGSLKIPPHLKKPPQVEEEDDDSSTDSDWMVTDIEDIKKAQAMQRLQSGANRPPELFILNGETKRVRFRDDGQIAGIWQYSFRANGKWVTHTMPPEGEKNFYSKAGLKPGFKYVYEVIDLDGYTDKKTGKVIKNIPRFLKISGRLNEQLEAIKAKRGGLTGFVIDITRRGEGTQTTYHCMPDPPTPTPTVLKNLPRLAKDFRKYYAPLPPDQQKLVVGMVDDETEDSF